MSTIDADERIRRLEARLAAVVDVLRELITVADKHLGSDAHRAVEDVLDRFSRNGNGSLPPETESLAGSLSMSFSFPHRE